MLRLLRLGRVLNANNLSLTSSGGVLYRFLRLLAGIAMLMHFFACLWRGAVSQSTYKVPCP